MNNPGEFDQAAKAIGAWIDDLNETDFDSLSAQDETPIDAALRADMLLSAAGALQVIAYRAVAVSLGFVQFMSRQLENVTVDVAGDELEAGLTRDELVDLAAAADPDQLTIEDALDDDLDDDDEPEVEVVSPFDAPPAGDGWKQ